MLDARLRLTISLMLTCFTFTSLNGQSSDHYIDSLFIIFDSLKIELDHEQGEKIKLRKRLFRLRKLIHDSGYREEKKLPIPVNHHRKGLEELVHHWDSLANNLTIRLSIRDSLLRLMFETDLGKEIILRKANTRLIYYDDLSLDRCFPYRSVIRRNTNLSLLPVIEKRMKEDIEPDEVFYLLTLVDQILSKKDHQSDFIDTLLRYANPEVRLEIMKFKSKE